MGRIKMLFLGAIFCLMVSSTQALVFEIPIIPGVEAVIAADPGLKLGLPFLGGTVKHTITFGGLYKDIKYACQASGKALIGTCINGTVTKKDDWNKSVAIFAAQTLRQESLEKKLKEFYVLKERFKELSLEEKRRCIVLRHEIKDLLEK